MRTIYLLGAVCIAAFVAVPAMAASPMATPGMMPSSAAMATMPDGHMGSMMMSDDAMTTKMMGMAKPISACTMVMTDKDGKVSMVDTSSADAKAECEKLAMMTPAAAPDMSKATPGMMQGGMAMAMMPDGHMGSMAMTDEAMTTKMIEMSTPAAACMLMVTDKDGKVSMVDTSTAEAKAECEKLAMTAPAM